MARRTCAKSYFNPRSPHGERHPPFDYNRINAYISIHAPRTGSDTTAASTASSALENFNPRSPHGERRINVVPVKWILYNFNPRSPHGERRVVQENIDESLIFQSTLPARGATRDNRK